MKRMIRWSALCAFVLSCALAAMGEDWQEKHDLAQAMVAKLYAEWQAAKGDQRAALDRELDHAEDAVTELNREWFTAQTLELRAAVKQAGRKTARKVQ